MTKKQSPLQGKRVRVIAGAYTGKIGRVYGNPPHKSFVNGDDVILVRFDHPEHTPPNIAETREYEIEIINE